MDVRRWIPVLLVVAVAAVMAGCGEDSGSGGDDAGSTTPSATDEAAGGGGGEQAEADLQVTITQVGGKNGVGLPVPSGIRCTKSIPATCTETIECPVDAVGDPARAEVCTWLAGDGRDVLTDEPRDDEVCTEIYGGPEVATVTGTLDGDEVDATFSRENGCAIARYDAVSPLWTGGVDAGADSDVPDIAPPTDAPDTPVTSPPSEPEAIDDPPEAFE